jgi:hypothetical protein
MFLYHLKLNDHGMNMRKYLESFDGVLEMIISAESDTKARFIAHYREKDHMRESTRHMWAVDIVDQVRYIDCVMIGSSYIGNGVVMTSERHD